MNQGVLKFLHHDKMVEIDFTRAPLLPSTTVLNFLRTNPQFRGTKEGCAEGDCGACTVVIGELDSSKMIRYYSVDSCLMFLPALHGKRLITVENLAKRKNGSLQLHPVQQAIVANHGSQCGFCTPGYAMSMFAFYKNRINPTRETLIDAFSGNLCRCTGYKPLADSIRQCCSQAKADHFDDNLEEIVEKLARIKQESPSLKIVANGQTYLLPAGVSEALELRAGFHTAKVVNGATDTAINQNKTHRYLPQIIDLSQVSDLKTITATQEGFLIGSGVSIEQLKEAAKNHFAEMLPILDVFASQQIRNVATIGGNIANASPVGDLLPLLMALNASVVLASVKGQRKVALEGFITGYRSTCLQSEELITGIFLPRRYENSLFYCEKVSTRRDVDISAVSIAVNLRLNGNGCIINPVIVFGGMDERVKRAKAIENFIEGQQLTLQTASLAGEMLTKQFSPISDARGSKDFRVTIGRNLLVKAFESFGCS
ncbi:MAG TPA: xanthine dehydrogenase small subunit [Bacteroidales bacterium]|nr:xanthine dehydrogenase small subunit [Bacteroidales bacterium]